MTRWWGGGDTRGVHFGFVRGPKNRFLRASLSLARLRMARNDKVVGVWRYAQDSSPAMKSVGLWNDKREINISSRFLTAKRIRNDKVVGLSPEGKSPTPSQKSATRMGHPAERRALHTAVFFHAAIFGHLERVDVDGAGIGIDIGVQDDVMAFMAFDGVGIVDGPALAVFVGGEGFAVIADFANDVSALGGSHGGTAALAHVAHVVLSEKCSGCANQCGCKGKS